LGILTNFGNSISFNKANNLREQKTKSEKKIRKMK
jgi:hypothetical protein